MSERHDDDTATGAHGGPQTRLRVRSRRRGSSSRRPSSSVMLSGTGSTGQFVAAIGSASDTSAGIGHSMPRGSATRTERSRRARATGSTSSWTARRRCPRSRRARAGRVARPPRGLVLFAGAAALARRRARDRAQPPRRARRARRRALLSWKGAPVPLFKPSQKDVREMLDGLAPHEDRSSHRRVHGLAHCHHEKTIVIDDRVAFVGGIDLTLDGGDPWTPRSTSPAAGSAGTTRRCDRRPRGGGRRGAFPDALAGSDRELLPRPAVPDRQATSRRRS